METSLTDTLPNWFRIPHMTKGQTTQARRD